MIGRLSGRLIAKHPPQVVVDVQGVGYELDVPMSTFYQLARDRRAEVALHTHLVVREDAHVLYGFATQEERTVPAADQDLRRGRAHGARRALGHERSPRSRGGRDAGCAAIHVKIPGIGKKTAERLLLELKDRNRPPDCRDARLRAGRGDRARVAPEGAR
jgi:holliday junction DNA helicase RuvA